MADGIDRELPPEWGTPDDWVSRVFFRPDGPVTVYIRVTDFASRTDAMHFHQWSANDYQTRNHHLIDNEKLPYQQIDSGS